MCVGGGGGVRGGGGREKGENVSQNISISCQQCSVKTSWQSWVREMPPLLERPSKLVVVDGKSLKHLSRSVRCVGVGTHWTQNLRAVGKHRHRSTGAETEAH